MTVYTYTYWRMWLTLKDVIDIQGMWLTLKDVIDIEGCDWQWRMWLTFKDVIDISRMWLTLKDVIDIEGCDWHWRMWLSLKDVIVIEGCDCHWRMWLTLKDVIVIEGCDGIFKHVIDIEGCDWHWRMWLTLKDVIVHCRMWMKFMVTFVPIFLAFMVGMYNLYLVLRSVGEGAGGDEEPRHQDEGTGRLRNVRTSSACIMLCRDWYCGQSIANMLSWSTKQRYIT